MFEITHMHGTFNHRDAAGVVHDMLEEHMAFFPGQSVLLADRAFVVQTLLQDGAFAILAGLTSPVSVRHLRAVE